jgi:hypothetical protein
MKPPAEINAEVTLPSGDRIRWDAASPDVKKRPLDISFDTESGRGFSSASVRLDRPTDRTYPELGLLNELTLTTATGQTVYQGRAQGIPVSDDFSFDCDGWASHGEQRQITDLIIDRDLGAWGGISQMLLVIWSPPIASTPYEADYTASADKGQIAFAGSTDKVIRNNSRGAIAYRAPTGCQIGGFRYSGTEGNTTSVAAATVARTTGDMTSQTTSSLTLDGTSRTVDLTGSGATALVLEARASAQHTATSAQFFRKITPGVHGDTGITYSVRSDNLTGFTASDGIRYLANKWCPKWDTSGIQTTGFLIPHAVWREPTTPLDAIRQLNGYHLWKLGVWEDRRLVFEPYDLSVADWQVANGVDGVRVEYQGDTTENLYNGVTVTFTDFTGEQQRLTPNDSEDLRDRSDFIAANQWNDEAWLSIDVSWPTTADGAVEIGRIALANANQARRPSTITVPMHIKDIHGHWWPSSYVRADQTILVSNQGAPVPRTITRTSWSNHQLTITTDNAVDTLEVFNQRVSGALQASGLT